MGLTCMMFKRSLSTFIVQVASLFDHQVAAIPAVGSLTPAVSETLPLTDSDHFAALGRGFDRVEAPLAVWSSLHPKNASRHPGGQLQRAGAR
jgi:hypothetical protein